MARPRKQEHERRSKWPVLNVTPCERATIEAAAQEAELSVNAYLIACTRQTRLVRRGDRVRTVRQLARIDAHLEGIARSVMTAPLSARDAGSLLLALRRIEMASQADVSRMDEDDDVRGADEC